MLVRESLAVTGRKETIPQGKGAGVENCLTGGPVGER